MVIISQTDSLFFKYVEDIQDKAVHSLYVLKNDLRRTGIPKCILTHLSCHSWKEGQLIAGMTPSERKDYENKHDGLTFAYDGMRVPL